MPNGEQIVVLPGRDPDPERISLSRDLAEMPGDPWPDAPPVPRQESPLLSAGPALAGANWKTKGFTPPTEAEDGLLTGEDARGLDPRGIQFVVLSAGDTGLGQVQTGEGVFGLRRAFLLAGARTLVMGLGKVPDDQTRRLMEDFRRRVRAGMSYSDALRGDQLGLRNDYPQALYWGAFICRGDPGLRTGPEAREGQAGQTSEK